MKLNFRSPRLLFFLLLWLAVPTIRPAEYPDRLAAPIDDQRMVALEGSRNPRIDEMVDEGPVDPGRRIRGLCFRFKPKPAQSAALERLLDDQQNPSSPRFHAWLTPEEFGEQFGPSAGEIAKVTGWLESKGFQIDYQARSRTWLAFSGTAGQVRDTFQTELHHYRSDGTTNIANATEARLPAELASMIYGIRGLDDFTTHSGSGRMKPRFESIGKHGLGPGDLAVVYDVNPLYNQGLNGAGQRIAVLGQGLFHMADVQKFRSEFALPKNDPQVILVPGSPDPGFVEKELPEATADVEYAGAMAPLASVFFVYSFAVEISQQYAVDQNIAPVISDSYAICEKAALQLPGKSDEYRATAQQANAQGITWISISGDTGPAGCERQNQDTAGRSGFSARLVGTAPEVTSVGGTEFSEGSGNYWGKEGPGLVSVLSYIPERAWNDTASDGTLAASGGGASIFYPKPSWQTGPGVPNDNRRHVPDISFNASWDHDFYVYVFEGDYRNYGGTSSAAPFFAGVVALLNQYVVSSGLQSRPGLGNINPRLYQLAQTTSGVFHDITSGDTIIPCQLGTPDCTTGEYGFRAGPGYDQATGLGSIDIYNLFLSWAGAPPPPPPTGSSAMGLLSAPSILVKNPKPDPGCSADYPYLQQLELVERDGVEVRLTSFVAAGNNWSDQISDWFGSLRLSPFGSLHANICWQLDTAPDTFHYEVDGVDSKGNKITTALDVPIKVAGQPPGKFSLSETSIVLGVKAAESASATINVDLPATEAWTVTVLPANSKTTWLTTSPQSGRGPGQIKLIASGAGLAKGAYTATLLVESTYCVPSFITVPVTFLVGPSASTTITAVQNAASFAQAFAPGMLMSVYGTHLAAHTLAASSSPLPLSLDGVSATVNGIPAPIWFVSPGQVNLQIPYEVAAGKALVTVNNGGEVGVYPFLVSATAPGIFNNSGMLTPEASGARGSTVSLYLTGDGELNPMIDTGAPPPASTPSNQLPKPRAKVEVTVGGVPAKVDFVGNPWLVGVTQINFTVPSNAALGRQPVVVTVGGQASAAETLIVR